MKVIGLTGGIASGKSTVSQILKSLCAYVVDADLLAHEIYENDTVLFQKLVETFGTSILSNDQQHIDRKKLGEIVFKDTEKRKLLESLVHPAVRKAILHKIKEAGKLNHQLCIVDAALLVETGFYKYYDGLIVVKATPEQQFQRLKLRNALSDEEIRERLNSQAPLEEKLKVADWVIDNSSTLDKTEKQVRDLYTLLSKI